MISGQIDSFGDVHMLSVTLVFRQASSMKLPVDDFNAAWSELCNNAFANLQVVVANEVGDDELLPLVSAVLTRVGFDQAVQGTLY